MFETAQELRELLSIGEIVFTEKPEIAKMTVSDALDYLNDGTQDMIHNRWGAVARMYVGRIRDLSFDNIHSLMSTEDIPEYLSRIAIFALQDEYGFTVVPFINYARKQGILTNVLSYCFQNIVYDNTLSEADLTVFIDHLDAMPEEKRSVILQGFAQLILKTECDDLAFEYVLSSKTKPNVQFLNVLIQEEYDQNKEKGEKYLVSLLQHTNAKDFVLPITVGIRNSLYVGTAVFEEYFQIISSLGQEENRSQIIPCYVEYMIVNEEDNDIRRCVVGLLRTLEVATVTEKIAFFNATNFRKDLPKELKDIQENILTQAFDKDSQMLGTLSFFFYRKLKERPVECILEQLHQIFILNKYGLLDYREFFDAFDNVWRSILSYPDQVWTFFMRMMFAEEDGSFVFALGLYDLVIDIDSITRDTLRNRIKVEEACILIKLLSAFAIMPVRICRFAFQLLDIICEGEDWSKYKDTYMNYIYVSYPGTSKEISERYAQSENEYQRSLVETISSQFEADELIQEKWKELPDLWPSEEHRRIYNTAWLERNNSITKQAMQESLFGNIFPRAVLQYGKRVAYVQKTERNKHRYNVQELASYKKSIEIPRLYTESPLTWLKCRIEALEERRAYIEAHTERLSVATERKG